MTHSPGWGFVNHGSSVIFSGNVAYDYTGAGFVAEAGMSGEFLDNLAVGGRGIDEYAFRKIYLSKRNGSGKQTWHFAVMGLDWKPVCQSSRQ